jgi:Icc-related predicted phosphoesterase
MEKISRGFVFSCYKGEAKSMRLAAISDLHYNRESRGKLEDLFRAMSDAADIVLLCGDLTDYGHHEEAELLAEDLHAYVHVPILGVLGNHDFESGSPEKVRGTMQDAGVKLLDGESAEIDGIGFAGTCGFAGGFDQWALNPWGEKIYKEFVQAAVDEALKLETALSRLQTETRIVILHYAPIRQTILGESPEIFPFLGSSRLEDPLNHYDVTAAFHGHAHKGAPVGSTSKDVPVYNVSIPVLRRQRPDAPPFLLYDVETRQPVES